ncbi:hypothetical protein [Haloplanus sp.]|uniref:hypothetical protein n=1 Tax=Haloplanus sp. TaxID=1961696 RepID=UPI0026143A76|nr:hypothetical protein [Haloplanus sp.]
MADPESDPSVSVSTEEVRVGKAFEADRFPVPAIAFQIESLAEDPIRIRLVEHIPESFPMEGVGFHPDYDSDNWTAYRDHRVAYERTIDPGESVLTVYGIRIDDPSEADDFLDEPTIELIETDTDPDTGDVLGRETTQVVRDALSGDGDDGLSDLDSGPLLGDPDDPPATEPNAEVDADADTDASPTPRDPADDLDAAMHDGDTNVTRVDTADAAPEVDDDAEDEDEAEAEAEADAEAPESVHSSAAAESLDPRDSPAAADGSVGDDDRDDAAETDPAPEHTADRPAVETDSVAAALAAEIRADRVDDDDLSVLREALDEASPTSVDARIGRLQSEVADLLAYRDALEGFLDENGTAEEALENVTEELSDLTARVESLDESLSTAETDRADLRDEVAAITDDVAAVSDRIESLDDGLDELGETVDSLDDRLETVEAFENDIEALRSNIDDLQTFRNRLGDAFGAGQG